MDKSKEKRGFRQIRIPLFMRKYSVLLLALLFCTHASQVFAQEKQITLNLQNAKLELALDNIETQSGYLFVYDDNVDVDQPVSIVANGLGLRQVLDRMLSPIGIAYTISNTSIVLSAAPQSRTPREISGVVNDQNGNSVIGAGVTIKGTTIGVSTAVDGSFAMQIPADVVNPVLEVSYIGYEAVELPVGGRTAFTITLQESALDIDRVVVTALGIKRAEKALSYNVQQVDAESIVGNKDVNFVNSLSGKVAGVNINASSSGIGAASSVVMRGVKSIQQSSNALYVIDGVPMFAPRKSDGAGGSGLEQQSQGISDPIADLNPEDIASISVLSGAAAAALYGSDAANGVILVTTKRGAVGSVSVTVTSNTEISSPFVMPRFQTRYGTGDLSTGAPVTDMSWGAKLNQFNYMGYDPRSDYFETGVTATETVSLTTGTDQNQTYLSAGAVNSGGIVPNNKYDRYNFTFRNTTKFLDDKMTLDVGATYIIQKDRNMTSQGEYANPLWGAYLFPRGNDWNEVKMFERYDPVRSISTQYWTVGDHGGTTQNPYWVNYRNLRENDKERYMLNASLNYQILDWLNVSGRVNVDNSVNDYTQKYYASTHNNLSNGSSRGFFGLANSKDKSVYADAMVNINKQFGDDWSLQANIGTSISSVRHDEMSVQGPIISEEIREENQVVGLTNFFSLDNISPTRSIRTQNDWKEQTQSVFASAEIGYKGTYYLTLTGRNDWPSMLAGPFSTSKSFFYPSVGASVVLSQIIDMPKWISYLKLRGSFASVGVAFPRQWANPRYAYDKTQYVNRTYMPIDLKPERTESWEAGFTMRLLRNLNIDFSYYNTNTKNQTLNIDLPSTARYTNMYVQTGSVRNRGVELSVNYHNTWGKFGWDTGYTFSANANKILSIAADVYDPQTGDFLLNIDELSIKPMGYVNFILRDGGTMGDLYSLSDFKRDANNNLFVDQNGNLESVELSDPVKLGSVLPKANMAWRNTFSYGNFNLGFMISARLGGVVYSRTQGLLDYYGVSETSAAARDLGYVEVNGGDHISPQTYFQTTGASRDIPQNYTYSATNVRLSEASIGYTIPRKWLGDVCDITVSVVGRNLWMIYNKAPFDPENVARVDNFFQGVDYMMMPSLRNVGFNVRVKF